MSAAGVLTICGDARATLTGYASRCISEGKTYSLAQEHEAALGLHIGAYTQARGTCVDQASSRACQDSLFASVNRGLLITPVTRIARGPVYAMARKHFNYGMSGGKNDGLVGAHWAEIAATVGIYPRRKVAGVDLATDEEKHATEWANYGIPPQLKTCGIKVRAHRPRTVDDLADCIFAGYFAAQCSTYYFDGKLSTGFAKRLSLNGGGHCEEVCGAYADTTGKVQFVRQQSWGDKAPAPGNWSIYPADSPSITLRPGSYPVHREDMAKMLEHGEVWAFQFTQGFEGVN